MQEEPNVKKEEQKTISVDMSTWKRLMNIRTELEISSLDDVIRRALDTFEKETKRKVKKDGSVKAV